MITEAHNQASSIEILSGWMGTVEGKCNAFTKKTKTVQFKSNRNNGHCGGGRDEEEYGVAF